MAFVKLDCGLLRSSLWVNRDHRSLFLTSLLMAEPYEVIEPMPQLEARSLKETGWCVPPGWYGMIGAAGVGIIRQDGMNQEEGLDALELLGAPDQESRSQDFEGRRLVRVDGGYIVLNFMKYRDKDHTAAIRQQRLRDRKRALVTALRADVTPLRNVTSHKQMAEAEAEADAKATTTTTTLGGFGQAWAEYPKRAGSNSRTAALKAYTARVRAGASPDALLAGVRRYAKFIDATGRSGTEFVKMGSSFFSRDDHWAEPWDVPATRGAQRAITNTAILQDWLGDSDGN